MTQGSRQNNIPTKDVHTLIPGTCDYITLCGKRDYADMIQLRIFQLRNFPGLFRWAQCNHKGPSKWKEGRRTQRDTVWEGLIHCGRLWRWREMAMSWDRWAAPRSWKKYRNEFTLAMDQTIPMMKPLPAMWWYLETGVVREGGRVRWGLKSGALMMGLVRLKGETRESSPCLPWHRARRQLSARQEENPSPEPYCVTPISQTSDLQNHEKINFHCLSPPAYGILLRQPPLTKTPLEPLDRKAVLNTPSFEPHETCVRLLTYRPIKLYYICHVLSH